MTQQTLPIESITIGDKRRPVDSTKVSELAQSIAEIGLINPITVTADKTLIAGAHRLQAAKMLGWGDITACVLDLTGLAAELAEIDENLIRNELHYIDRGVQLARRQDIWETLYPETRHGNTAARSEVKRNNFVLQKPFTQDTAETLGISRRTVEQEIQIADSLTPEVAEIVKSADIPKTAALKLARLEPEKQMKVVSTIQEKGFDFGKAVAEVQREEKRETVISNLEALSAKEAKAISGVYDVIVLDPPWPMQKIERDVRPNQTAFDYPTMSEKELAELSVPCADDCHVWVWTTQKFAPMALRLLEAWGLKYVCTFVWHKPGGFQPIGLPQYNCEFAIYARKGAPQFVDTKAFPTCFEAPRGAHSEKPEDFYNIVRRVTAGRRLDMFNRRSINGFDSWGNEAQ